MFEIDPTQNSEGPYCVCELMLALWNFPIGNTWSSSSQTICAAILVRLHVSLPAVYTCKEQLQLHVKVRARIYIVVLSWFLTSYDGTSTPTDLVANLSVEMPFSDWGREFRCHVAGMRFSNCTCPVLKCMRHFVSLPSSPHVR